MADYRKMVEDTSVNIAMGEIEGRRRSQEDSLQVAVDNIQDFSELSNRAQEAALKDTLAEIQTATQEMNSGSTANSTIAWLDKSGNVRATTANLGDSTSFLVIVDKNNELVSSTLMHKLHNPDRYKNNAEYSRVLKHVKHNDNARPPIPSREGDSARLGSGLAVSRSLGDSSHEIFGLSHDPEITHTKVKLAAGQKAFIVVACDGLTELNEENKPALTTQFLGEIVAEGQQKKDRPKGPLYFAMDKLITEAYCGGSEDNISVAVFPVADTPTSAAIFDGHGGDHVANTAGEMFYPLLKKQIANQLALQDAAKLNLQKNTVDEIRTLANTFIVELTQEIVNSLLHSNLKKELVAACNLEDDKTPNAELAKIITQNYPVELKKFIIEQSQNSQKLPVKLQSLTTQYNHVLSLHKAIASKSPAQAMDNAKALFTNTKVRSQLENGHGFWGKIFQLLGLTRGQKLGTFFDKKRKAIDDLPQPKAKTQRLG